MKYQFLLVVVICLLLGACSTSTSGGIENPTAALSSPDELTLTTIPQLTSTEVVSSATPAPTSTEELQPFRYHVFFGGNPQILWERENFEGWVADNLDIPGELSSGANYAAPLITDRYFSAVSAEPAYDVIAANVGGVFSYWVEQGYIADISDLWQENGWYEVYPPSVIDMASVDGKQYFVPLAQQWHPVWYRTVIFEQVGLSVPQTWDELITACETLDAAGYIPITVGMKDWNAPAARWFAYISLRLHGPEFYTSLMRGEVSWLDPRVREIFETWADMFEHQCFQDDKPNEVTYGQATAMFNDGEAAMYNLGEWLSESYTSGFPDTVSFFPVPPIKEDIPNAQVAHVFGAFIPTGATHPEQARAFLTHLGSTGTQNAQWEALGRVSTHLGVEQSIYSDLYRAGVEYVNQAEVLVPIFEIQGIDRGMNRQLLANFVSFFRNPAAIDSILEKLEAVREKEFGPASNLP